MKERIRELRTVLGSLGLTVLLVRKELGWVATLALIGICVGIGFTWYALDQARAEKADPNKPRTF